MFITFVLTLQSYIHEQAKTCMSRLTNKMLFCTCLKPLWQWVRKGNQQLRFQFLKNLEEPDPYDLDSEEDEEDEEPLNPTELLREMAFEVVNALVLYSAGNGPSGSNDYGFYPYGKEASWSTDEFKKIPTAWFALTFAEMIPFIFRDMSKWEDLRKKRSYPMTNLWPHATMKRYLNFYRAFLKHRNFLFEQYEKDEDGIYHGQERKERGEGDDLMVMSSDDSVDGHFV